MLKKIITTSTVDCPDNCGIIATVKDGRLVKLEGNPGHGHTRGFLCRKGIRYIDRVYDTHRVLYPLVKSNGKWNRIEWDDALDLVAEKLISLKGSFGNGSIIHIQGSSSWGATKMLVKRFFNLLGGVTTVRGSLCSGSAKAAQEADMGVRLGNDPESLKESRLITLWGRDPAKSSIHLMPILKEARKRGAKLISIDPIHTKTAQYCDRHIAPRPGSDGYLAAGIAKEILNMGLVDHDFVNNHTDGYEPYRSLIDSILMEDIVERCDIKAETIEELAKLYAREKPGAIVLGWGINKWTHSPEMIRHIDALGALTGNIGVTGGGVNHGFLTNRHFDLDILALDRAEYRRSIPLPKLGRGIMKADKPPVKMAWINGLNPAASCPDSNRVIKALKSLEFVVLVDFFLNDTADCADLFLPTTTFFEEEDMVISWGHNWIGPVNKAIEPLGEARSDLHIVQDLSRRFGFEKEMAGSERVWLKRIFKPMEEMGLSVEQVMASPVRCPVAPIVAFEDRRFPTPSGNYRFINSFYEEKQESMPYHLISPLSEKWLLSILLENDHPEMPAVYMSPETASLEGIMEDSKVVVRSSTGRLVARAKLTRNLRNDTLTITHGTWLKRGGGVNQLTEDIISSMGDMAGFYNTKVSIFKAEY